jgi:hypothetical protein
MVKTPSKSVVPASTQALIDAAVETALAARRVRSTTPRVPTGPESEHDRVARVLRLQNGFRGRILRYIIEKGPGVFTWESLHNAPALSGIDPSNMAACLGHIAWKMQGGSEVPTKAVADAGYRLFVDGRKENVRAMLSRTAPVEKKSKARKAKALPAPVVPAITDSKSENGSENAA